MSLVYSYSYSYYYLKSMLKPLVTIIVFLMVACAQDIYSLSDNTIFDGKKTVRVYNGMNDGILVYLHCRSKDNDLGQHVLAFAEFQKWSFNDNLFGTTLFWCTMNASNVHASFEVYRAKTEEYKCDTQCDRNLKKDGGYFFNQFYGYWEKRLSWHIPKTPSF
ncbi:hypothetical protein AAZX31_01G129600 [Glycine max]|uniref:S-protein homolog n=3 Tax=Glycine subgen. Soja TaxID=1462606 RepID=I1J7W6_SOYBN|nr:hypothetical protein JHK85_001809 [Glycine max]KAG5089149.1 hypothetical protein JHK86_001761 [Glycine max]KAH1163041.1 hypothetical protein GYH30_001539 [Glycine max]KRH76246.1 hypothetical protein GLYMA_01G141800v4 [Glycine max]RZC29929.1 S-protein-like 74 [Glycine soja]